MCSDEKYTVESVVYHHFFCSFSGHEENTNVGKSIKQSSSGKQRERLSIDFLDVRPGMYRKEEEENGVAEP